MTIACDLPDTALGVVPRLTTFADCQARALGENGFQALAGSGMLAGALTASLTVYVALIGYRLLLGSVPNARDVVGWAVRLGVAVALATSWPAFRTLLYDVAIDGPTEIAAVLVAATGLPADDADRRLQAAYDRIRIGIPAVGGASAAAGAAASTGANSVPGLPGIASLLLASTAGAAAALRLATGFLLAIGPLVGLAVLFEGAAGLVSGWLRALAGTALGLVAVTVGTAVELPLVEAELRSRGPTLLAMELGGGDPQGVTSLVVVSALATLACAAAAWRMSGAVRLPAPRPAPRTRSKGYPDDRRAYVATGDRPLPASPVAVLPAAMRTRAAAVADAVAQAARRDRTTDAGSAQGTAAAASGRALTFRPSAGTPNASTPAGLGVGSRREAGRRSRSALRRDGSDGR